MDTHCVGGSSRKLDVYGWAARSPAKGIFTLRNPADKPQGFVVELAKMLELPEGIAAGYTISAPFSQRQVAGLSGPRKANVPIAEKGVKGQ